MIKRLKRWNKWRKFNANGWHHKFLVLLGLKHSPTFQMVLTDKEEDKIHNYIMRSLKTK